MIWYTSLYTKQRNGQFKLLDYAVHPNYEAAQAALSKLTVKYDSDFWHLENTLGGLDDSAKGVFHKRTKYSHNAKAAKAQACGEDRARKVLRSIRALGANSKLSHIQSIMTEIRCLKPYLSNEQYQTLLQELERQPAVRKLQQAATSSI